MRAFVTTIVLALGLAACGGATSSLDVCHADCDRAGRCGAQPQTQISMCHDNCNARAPQFIQADKAANAACQNAETQRSQLVTCDQGDCGQVVSCQQQATSICVGAR